MKLLTRQWWTRPQWSRLVLHRSSGSQLHAARYRNQNVRSCQLSAGYFIGAATGFYKYNYFWTDPLHGVFVVCLDKQLYRRQLLLLPLLWLFYFWGLWTHKPKYMVNFSIFHCWVFSVVLSSCDSSINPHYLQQEGSSSFLVCGRCGRASWASEPSEWAGQGAGGWEPSKRLRPPGPEATPEKFDNSATLKYIGSHIIKNSQKTYLS